MFKKIYIHNYKCFENFELEVDEIKTLLFLGKNGTGKSSLLNVLTILRD
ncbi:AAA family ATPase, partial [Rodentibacter trehalosifermentans]